MKPYDVVILTDPRYVNPKEINAYNRNVLYEDNLVQQALEKQGLKTHRVSWDDINFDWANTHYALFRSTWDYFDRFPEFSKWLDIASKQTKLINSEKLIRWNIDKRYLKDLESKGVHIPNTIVIEKGTKTSLRDIHQQNNLKDTVLKPVFSGAARHTYKLNKNNLAQYETFFQELIIHEPMLLQTFQQKIVTEGEKSLMLFDGEYSHAVLKIAKKGDFRVQDDFGGSVHKYHPTQEEIAFAENTINACTEKPLYARVDIFNDNNGHIALAELELIEPELWFRNHPTAADKLAKAIKKLF